MQDESDAEGSADCSATTDAIPATDGLASGEPSRDPSWVQSLLANFSDAHYLADADTVVGEISDRTPDRLPLNSVPPGSRVILSGGHRARTLEFIAVPCDVEVVLADVHAGTHLTLTDFKGQMTITGHPVAATKVSKYLQAPLSPGQADVDIHVPVDSFGGFSTTSLTLVDMHVRVVSNDHLMKTTISNCILSTEGSLRLLHVVGANRIQDSVSTRVATNGEKAVITAGSLLVAGGCLCSFGLEHDDSTPFEVTLSGAEGNWASLQARGTKHLRVMTEGDSVVTIEELAQDVAVTGSGRLQVARDAVVIGLTSDQAVKADLTEFVEPAASLPLLEAFSGSRVVELSGRWRVGRIAESTLTGHPVDGFTIDRFVAKAGTNLVDRVGLSVEGAVMENFTVPGGPLSGQVWKGLNRAALISPSTHRTPIEAYPIWKTTPQFLKELFSSDGNQARTPRGLLDRFRQRHKDYGRISQVAIDTIYVRDFAETLGTRNYTGSTRSRANWTSYRLRQMAAAPGEKILLCAYRLLGYGERPGPAFLTWIAAVLMATAWSLRDRTLQLDLAGFVNLWEGFAFWAVPSFGLLNMPELPNGTNASVNTFLVHALLAVPFFTGAVSLRNLVKASRAG